MALAFLGLGSNLGNGPANLLAAWQRLAKVSGITPLALSSPYASAPVNIETEHWFTNAVGVVETTLSPTALLDTLLAVEQELGRDRSRGPNRTVDLDLLYYDDLVINTPTLTLPHPELDQRLFVLAPLAELAPDHRHPVLGRTSRELLAQLPSGQVVRQGSWPLPRERR